MNPRPNQVPAVNISSRELITRAQIDALLSIIGLNTSAIGHYLNAEEEDDPKSLKPAKPEARIALENTLIAACARLDSLINDDSRWDMGFQTKVEKAFAEAQDLQKQVLEAQRKAAEEVVTPHFLLRPSLLRLKDPVMSWCAFLGNVEQMEYSIVGVGRTPKDAIAAFDDNFRGVTDPKILEWCSQREKNLEMNAPDAPFPTPDNNENRQTVEQERTGTSEETSGGGKDRPDDCGHPGANSQGGIS